MHQDWRDALHTRLTAYPVPTLIVWGEHDQVLPAAHLDAAARVLPHARTVLLPDTGHLPQVERAEEFARLVTDLWSSCRTDAGNGAAAHRAQTGDSTYV